MKCWRKSYSKVGNNGKKKRHKGERLVEALRKGGIIGRKRAKKGRERFGNRWLMWRNER